MKIQTKALVINTVKYGEKSLIVRCFTRSSGPVSYLIKNAYPTGKNKKLQASLFQPLALLELTATHKNTGKLEYLSEARLTYFPKTLQTQIEKSSVLIFLTEVLNNCLKNEDLHPELFDYLEARLIAFDAASQDADFHLKLMAGLTKYLGFYPDWDTEGPYFNLQQGKMDAVFLEGQCLTEEETQNFMTAFSTSATVKFQTQKQRNNALETLLKYYSLFVAGFAYPKSVAVLREIFRR